MRLTDWPRTLAEIRPDIEWPEALQDVMDKALARDASERYQSAAQGSSGSPVFDAREVVIGVIYGGAADSGGRSVYAVSVDRLAAQLPEDAQSILR